MWLLIDDKRDLNTELIARNFKVGIRLLAYFKGDIEALCIDHDLGEEKTGYDLIKWAISNNVLPNHVQIVSDNPVGVKNIGDALRSEGYNSKDYRNWFK